MPDGAVVFGRERGCTDFEKVFGRVSCWKIRRQHALRSDDCDEERQQRKNREQKDENGEGGHQGRPGGYGCGWPLSPSGSSSLHIFRRYDGET